MNVAEKLLLFSKIQQYNPADCIWNNLQKERFHEQSIKSTKNSLPAQQDVLVATQILSPPPVSFSLFWYCSSCNLSCRQAAMENKPYAPEQWRAWLTPVIFVVCIIMFVYTMHVNNCPAKTADSHQCVLRDILGRYSFQPWKENYLLGPSIST